MGFGRALKKVQCTLDIMPPRDSAYAGKMGYLQIESWTELLISHYEKVVQLTDEIVQLLTAARPVDTEALKRLRAYFKSEEEAIELNRRKRLGEASARSTG